MAAFVLLLAQGHAHSFDTLRLEDQGNKPIVNLIKQSRQTLDILAYVITDKNIAIEIAEAAQRGVKVRILLDELQVRRNRYFQEDIMRSNRIEVRVLRAMWTTEFGIVDNNILYTGGYLLHTDFIERPKRGFIFVFDRNSIDLRRFTSEFDHQFGLSKRLWW